MWKNPVDDLYGEIVLNHYHKPRNRGSLKNPSASAEVSNVFCGDEVKLQLAIAGDRITEVRFLGQGCTICLASASMLTVAITGLSLKAVEFLAATFRGMMDGSDREDEESLGDLEALQGVRRFPARVKCAKLPWAALEAALERYQNAKM
jgi:nitrogen fixation NifU-like protein